MSTATGGNDGDARDGEDADRDPLIGRVFASRYEIEGVLGQGAMGRVYRARHVKVGRAFAVKILHNRLLDDEKQKRRFDREAELAGKLHHINVVGVVDVGETEDGIHYMVMEFAVGQPLTALVQGPMASARVIHIAKQLCDGLHHAHENGLIHRDFKPDNVIVERDRFGDERPRIVDFGISILREEAGTPERADRLTTAGLVLGTPHYMAPEHAMGGAIDHRIDLFALGVILYELLTGSLPFDGDGVDVARANLLTATPPMGIRVPGVQVDPLLEAFTRKLMEKDPKDRPQSGKEAHALLDLIARDRDAAAAALGIKLPRQTGAPAPDTAPVVPRAPNNHTSSTRAETAPEQRGGHDAASLDSDAHAALDGGRRSARATTARPASPRRWWAVALGIGLVMAIVAIVTISTRGGSTQATKHESVIAMGSSASGATVTTPASAPLLDAGSPPATVDAQVAEGLLADAPAALAIDAPVAATPPLRPTRSPTRPARPHPTPKPIAPPVVTSAADDLSSSAVAQLYGSVGRALKALDVRKGSAATADLWPRYLRIKINDVLAIPDKRAEANKLLRALQHEIAAFR